MAYRYRSRTDSFSCSKCRRNRSFCTKERPSCLTCRKGNHECVYPASRKITVLASYVCELEARVEELEATILAYQEFSASALRDSQSPEPSEAQLSTPSPPRTLSFDEAQLGDEPDFQMQPLTEGLSNLVISPSGNPQYLGISSSTALGRRFRDAVGIVNPFNANLDIDREVATYNRDALRLRRMSSVEEACELPPYSLAKRYFDAQYRMIGTIFAFILPEQFHSQLLVAYNGPPDIGDQEACLTYCQVLLVLAFGQMYSVNQYVSSQGPPGFGYFTAALRYLPCIHEEPSVKFCGVLALIGYFMQNLSRRDVAFMYVGLAQRMAISLAMHEEVSVLGLDEMVQEQRRRTWWSIYSLDRILCVKYGNPVTMHDEDITVVLPSRLPQEFEYCPAVVLRHYTVLSRILGQIMSRLYSHESKSGSVLMAAVEDIMNALAKWEQEVPDQLRFDPACIEASRESISTFLHYYQCINMTARQLLFHVAEKRLKLRPTERSDDWRKDLSPRAIFVIEQCIFAARKATEMMTAAAKKNLIAVFGYMDGEHAFSAAIVLVMVCVAFPYELETARAMNDALSILENMANNCNHHIAARWQLLVQLSSMIEWPSSPLVDDDPSTAGSVFAPQIPPLPEHDDSTGDENVFKSAFRDTELNLNHWTQLVNQNLAHPRPYDDQ